MMEPIQDDQKCPTCGRERGRGYFSHPGGVDLCTNRFHNPEPIQDDIATVRKRLEHVDSIQAFDRLVAERAAWATEMVGLDADRNVLRAERRKLEAERDEAKNGEAMLGRELRATLNYLKDAKAERDTFKTMARQRTDSLEAARAEVASLYAKGSEVVAERDRLREPRACPACGARVPLTKTTEGSDA